MERAPARTALTLFGFALALQLAFWLGHEDRWLAWHAGFQGDAPLWQELATSIARSEPVELLRVPLRPPGMQWFVAAIWDGDPGTAWRVRLVFAALGASVAPLVFLLLHRHAPAGIAVTAGALCASAGNLLLLGSGPHAELPYLVLVLVGLFDQQRLQERPSATAALRWGALHGATCLLRAEHALTFAAFLVLLWVARAERRGRSTTLALGAALVVLAPWHAVAWRMVDDYNRTGAPSLPSAGSTTPGGLPWRADALERLRTLPAFQQGPVFGFVQDTARVRGRPEVVAADLDAVVEAYGVWPEPLPRTFVCLFGGLNFWLANTPEADAGFSNAALDRPPPLAGGDGRYPPGLRHVLPRGGALVLSYPPHLDAVVHGYRRGLAEWTQDPSGAFARVASKLWHAAEGATPTLGGFALPIGMSGLRRPVDLVVATGAWPALWRCLTLIAAAIGLWSLRRERWAWPWFAWLATRLLVVALFFGYARHGALLLPVVALGVAALVGRLANARFVAAGLAALLAVELARALAGHVTVDGLSPTAAQAVEHGPRAVRYGIGPGR